MKRKQLWTLETSRFRCLCLSRFSVNNKPRNISRWLDTIHIGWSMIHKGNNRWSFCWCMLVIQPCLPIAANDKLEQQNISKWHLSYYIQLEVFCRTIGCHYCSLRPIHGSFDQLQRLQHHPWWMDSGRPGKASRWNAESRGSWICSMGLLMLIDIKFRDAAHLPTCVHRPCPTYHDFQTLKCLLRALSPQIYIYEWIK